MKTTNLLKEIREPKDANLTAVNLTAVTEPRVTTKELAETLGVDVRTVNETVERLLEGTFQKSEIKMVSNGGRPTKVFTEKQATIIKNEISKHYNLFSIEKVKNTKWYTIEELAELCGISTETLKKGDSPLSKLSIDFKVESRLGGYHNTQKFYSENVLKALKEYQIKNGGKFMTIRNVADSLDVSYSSVYRAVCKLFPDKTKNGKLSMLNEIEVSQISRELKTDYHTAQLTFSAGEKVKNTTTNLEILENYKKANDDFVALLNRMYEEEKQKREIAEKTLNRIADGKGCFTMNQAAKALKLPYGNRTLFKKLQEFGILNQDNTPRQEQINNGNFKVVVKFINDTIGNKNVTLVTSKGLTYLAKKFNTTIDESVKADYED